MVRGGPGHRREGGRSRVRLRQRRGGVDPQPAAGGVRGGGRGDGAAGRRGGGKNDGYAAANGSPADGVKDRFSFAHGCLGGHLLSGEESFILERRSDDSVWYGVRTFSRPAHPLALASYPIVRALQRRFARDSTRAMAEGMAEGGPGGVRSA